MHAYTEMMTVILSSTVLNGPTAKNGFCVNTMCSYVYMEDVRLHRQEIKPRRTH